jgi:type II secretory pathway component PulJ
MANFIRNTQVKAMTSIWTAKQKARELADRTAEALTDRTGQGTLDVLISIVLGALILAGLYLIVDDTVLPTITQRIKDMFNYGG